MIILNKVDLVGSEEIGRIRDWLDKHFHRFRLFETSHANVPLEILLSAGSLAPSPHDEHEDIECNDPGCRHGHHLHYRPCNGDHADVFSTWTFETDQPLSLEALRRAATKLPASIYRSKGVIHSCEEPGRRSILQVVGKRADISTESGWNGRPPRTRIVVIGAPGSIIPHQLQAHFDACIAVGQ
jgi:G3E family GTPase